MPEEKEPTKEGKLVDHLALVASRPPAGKSGEAVQVLSNSFPVSVPVSKINIYQITFDPEIPEDASEKRRRSINQKIIRDKLDAAYGV